MAIITGNSGPQVPHQSLASKLKDKVEEGAHAAVDSVESFNHSVASSAHDGAQAVHNAKSFKEAVKSGAHAGAEIGEKVGNAVEFPAGVAVGLAGLAVGGPVTAVIAGIDGGAEIGGGLGEVTGAVIGAEKSGTGSTLKDRLNSAADKLNAHDPQATASTEHGAATGELVGGVAGGVLGAFNPIAQVVGAVDLGENVVKDGSKLLGGAAGATIGGASYGAHKAGEAISQAYHKAADTVESWNIA